MNLNANNVFRNKNHEQEMTCVLDIVGKFWSLRENPREESHIFTVTN